jgi:hypothetical protein
MKARAPALILICMIAAVFVWGVLQIFDMRFSRGDIYRPYSSLRADPLGTRIFYESLERISNIHVGRNEDSSNQFELAGNLVFFYVGTYGLILTEKELVDLEKFIKNGGRFVLTFYPQGPSSHLNGETDPTHSATASPTPTPRNGEDEVTTRKVFSLRDIAKRWNFTIGINDKFETTDATASISTVEGTIPWHSAAAFENIGPAWRTIYSIANRPVVIESDLGKGTIVLATDSYLLSNEAMRHDRRPAFLAWLVGDKGRVVFDEVHHGVSEVPGVSTLIRRYRLGGFVLAALVTAILLCWKNMVRLVPVEATRSGTEEFVSGKESFAGLTSLFRRNIAPSELTEVCFSEWNKSLPRAARSVQLTADRVRAAMEKFRRDNRSHRNPVDVYREISRIINEKKWKRST